VLGYLNHIENKISDRIH